MTTPDDRRYTEEHEWALVEGGNRVRVGITDYAQDALGDVVYVELPEVGREVRQGEAFAEVESTKSVSEVYAPVAGRVVEVNDALGESPDLVNSGPYGEGWFAVIEASDPTQVETLLDAAGYQEMIA
ncbi:MAG: glycine cleavage system protein GcvH [Actinomycetota bacterium]|nr:glycine cleavage system protein GcvH [Actinomycetota bacterium]